MDLALPKKILFRIDNQCRDETRTFITEILPEHVAHFNPRYKLHDHDFRGCEFDELKNVYEFKNVYGEKSPSDLLTQTLMVKVKSFVYGTFHTGIIMRLNIDDLESSWQRIIQPFSPHRWYPKLISLRNKLYIFGGIPDSDIGEEVDYDLEPFGEVYDPELDRWSTLVAPPQSGRLNKCFLSLFVASLGESEGKIMVYSPVDDDDDDDPVVYIYHIDTEVWETRSYRICLYDLVGIRRKSGSEVLNEYDDMLYWLDKRSAFIYAFDWKEQQLYSGPIIGLEMQHSFKTMIAETNVVSLHHLDRDLFYLFWGTNNRWENSDIKTSLHFTILRVVKYTPSHCLDAFVVGCLRDTTVSGAYSSYDALNI